MNLENVIKEEDKIFRSLKSSDFPQGIRQSYNRQKGNKTD